MRMARDFMSVRLRALHFEDAYQFLEALAFGVQHAAAKAREAVVTSAGVVEFARGAVAGFFDQALFDQALERAVKGRRPEPDFAAGALENFLHDAVAVLVAGGKREEDVEPVGFEREKIFGFRHQLIYILSDTQLSRGACGGLVRSGHYNESSSHADEGCRSEFS